MPPGRTTHVNRIPLDPIPETDTDTDPNHGTNPARTLEAVLMQLEDIENRITELQHPFFLFQFVQEHLDKRYAVRLPNGSKIRLHVEAIELISLELRERNFRWIRMLERGRMGVAERGKARLDRLDEDMAELCRESLLLRGLLILSSIGRSISCILWNGELSLVSNRVLYANMSREITGRPWGLAFWLISQAGDNERGDVTEVLLYCAFGV
jgi:hypothetical protein